MAADHGEQKKMSFFFTGTVYDFNNQDIELNTF